MRYRYQAAIVGRYSENVSPLPFVRFRRLDEASEWVIRMNDAHNERDEDRLTYYSVMLIPSRVQPVYGVPYWFTMVHHWISKRRCLRQGHDQTIWSSCNHCGEYLR